MFFCYILRSLNEKHKNITYIGFTDNPLYRINQHNGLINGGAKFTKLRRPWKLVLVISNFPNKIVALKFEWAWQNPFKSIFTRDEVDNIEIPKKVNKKKYYNSLEFKLQVLNILINSKLFEKIYLKIYIFDEGSELIKIKDKHLIEKVDEESFKEIIEKEKQNFKLNNNNNNDKNDETLENENLNDKCLICGELLKNNNLIEKKNNEISKENENNNNFISFSQPIINNSFLENNIFSQQQSLLLKNTKSKKIIEEDNIILINKYIVKCPFCFNNYHMFCIAESALNIEKNLGLIPKNAICPLCERETKWSDWIKELTDYNK